MDLSIRSLKEDDNIKKIFELCKQNNLITPNYATNIDVWNFQYVNNPIKRSWNAILINNADIGLIPLPMKVFSSDLLAGSISNGVISASVRNKLLPFNKSKTFAITPLIDECNQAAFNEGVDLIFVHSSIHSMIWRTLKYNKIQVDLELTYHSGLKYLFVGYYKQFNKKYRNRSLNALAKPYSLFLCGLNFMASFIKKIVIFADLMDIKNKEIEKVSVFNCEFNDLFQTFYDDNPNIITYKRDIDYLNWRFNNNQYLKYSFRVDDALAGYIILNKDESDLTTNSYTVVDCVILDEYLNYTSVFFRQLTKVKCLSIKFTHYLSCDYSRKLHKACLRQGYAFTINPFRCFLPGKKNQQEQHLYYKVSSSANLNDKQKEEFQNNNWFLTPIFFCPMYYPN